VQVRLEPELRELSAAECFALLASTTIGHLAISEKALPLVIPVRFHLVDAELTIESLLGNAVRLRAGVVAFEAELFNPVQHAMRAVVVRGFLSAAESTRSDREIFVAVLDRQFRLSTDEISGWTSPWNGDDEIFLANLIGHDNKDPESGELEQP
jgi:hypothetical protein